MFLFSYPKENLNFLLSDREQSTGMGWKYLYVQRQGCVWRDSQTEAGSRTKSWTLGKSQTPGLSYFSVRQRTWIKSLFFKLYSRGIFFFFSKENILLNLVLSMKLIFKNRVILVEIEKGQML